MRFLTKNSISVRGSIKSYLPVIFAILLFSVFFFGCGPQDVNQPTGYINLNTVGDKTIPATVYIEVIDREETVEPLPSFTSDSVFLRHFDVDKLRRKFSDELVGQGTGMIIDAQGHILIAKQLIKKIMRLSGKLK